jgi:hypothetical protein
MTKPSMNLAELLEKRDDGDFLRVIAEAVLQLIMETDGAGLIGRPARRLKWRNGISGRRAVYLAL